MKTLWFFGPLAGLMAGSGLISLYADVIGLRSRPDYGLAGFAGIGFVFIVGMWILIEINHRKFESAVEISSYFYNHLSECERQNLTEPDPRFEQNSGISQWKRNPPPPPT